MVQVCIFKLCTWSFRPRLDTESAIFSSLNILCTCYPHCSSTVTQTRPLLLSHIHKIWRDCSGEVAGSGRCTNFLKVSFLLALYLSQIRKVPLRIIKLFALSPRDLKRCIEVPYTLCSATADLDFWIWALSLRAKPLNIEIA